MSVRGGGGSSEVWCAVWCGGWRGCERRALSPPLLSVGAARRGHAWHTRLPMPWGHGVVSWGGGHEAHTLAVGRRRGEARRGSPARRRWGPVGGGHEAHTLAVGKRREAARPPTREAWADGALLAPAARGHRARRQGERRGREGERGRGRWAHASPRAGEAHALGARGGRAPS